MPCVPSVVINGGSPQHEMSQPLRSPQTAPVSAPTTNTTGIGTPAVTASAAVIPLSVRIAPSDRSRPPLMMMNVAEDATISKTEPC